MFNLGIWEIVLILVLIGTLVLPYFRQRGKTSTPKSKAYQAPEDATSVEYEELD